ncbi:MAG: zinc ribbon domain-containing protein [Melioribacteraceae bacterium]|nr:zinc ribbon domain-containing protein [Melioribacteraceae bacterium]MCF8354444.1 zinc ribbon domain-containing protein [Melioribacteraceae bacterium]MCF8394054.1 zinc ribbon domain-containing protein [Melioribacteraceae bacterium]MCF8419820.1 zinc ribbon domain-containing protein [Melioribacteraceae bacterium]
MPVFEYQCSDCSSKYDVYHKSLNNMSDIICPSCNSTNHKKLLSSFSASTQDNYSVSSGCSDGSCGVPAAPAGGCASGMCGLN